MDKDLQSSSLNYMRGRITQAALHFLDCSRHLEENHVYELAAHELRRLLSNTLQKHSTKFDHAQLVAMSKIIIMQSDGYLPEA